MKTILVIDEDGAVRESLRGVLEADGYKVMLADCRPEALADLDPEVVDLILLDITLPFRHGWDFYRRFASRNPGLSVILLDGQIGRAQAPFPVGACVFLNKPLDVPLLLDLVHELLMGRAEGTRPARMPNETEARLLCKMHAFWRPIPQWIRRIESQ